MILRTTLAALAMTLATPALSQLTLERIFASPSLSGPTPRLARLSPDGRYATLLRNRADDRDRYDLWAIDTRTGEARMLVDSARLGSGAELSEAEKMRRERARISGVTGIVSYSWSPDARTLLVPIDGDLFLASLDGTTRRLTETAATEIDAQVSRAGRYASFVRDQNLVVLDLASRQETALTSDGGGALSWGSAEFVAQEEMHRYQGHWWSPGDRLIAVQRTDESGVRILPRAAIGAEGTRVYDQRYPLAGTPNALVELWVMDPAGSGRVKVDLGSDPDIYLARVDWSADGRTLYVQRQSRDQQRLDLLAVDPGTGRSRVLFTETSKTWVNLHDNLRALKDGSILWSSERSGHMHLYRWRNGRWTQLTHGEWDVQGVRAVDEAGSKVYFTGNRDGAIEQHLYVASLARASEPTRLTETGWWNSADMDPTGRSALISRSTSAQPPQTYLADSTGKRIAWIEENRLAEEHPYAPYAAAHVVPTFGTLPAADGTPLHYRVYRPKAAAAGTRHPALVWVYGGPGAGRRVTRNWDIPVIQYLVSKGWVVFSLDNRGTPDRGKAFEDPIYKAMGGVEVADQLAGVEWLKRQDYVDGGRIGVYGWSYGGYMTLKLLEAAPGTFAAGISGAPVTRWELYDTHYTERFMGNPATEPAPYERAGALADAGKITDPLLVMHGMADDNVFFENTTALVAKLQAESKPFEMMVYPGKTHSMSGTGALIHMWRTIEGFLDREVKGAK